MTDPIHPEAEILSTALELPAAQRDAYLAEACRGNPPLRQQVEALLQAHEQAQNFLTAPPARSKRQNQGTVVSPPTEKTGDRIGRYKLLQQIGEGGCGVVYMAEQEEPVRRRVALKVIKLGMDTKSVIARFEAERQALALMDHHHIARVLDAGATETGRPYFVMELVRGIKITEFCDEHKIPTEARLKLFIQICQAIQHAHQKGIIHRDIKPSNILVTSNDGVPVPKVIDFGIAKATQGRLTDQTLFTAFEQFLGTPAYMSPEQAILTSLDIDTRSDIYSLGVLLYELLTGKTPFDQEELLAIGLDEMRRTIREKEPLKPSTRLSTMAAEALTTTAHLRRTEAPKLIHVIRGDLDWIVMKCLEKDRVRRYETANGLAADIQRHLNCEPVVARPPSNWYRLRKLAQRNWQAVATSGTIVLMTVVALVVLVISNIRIKRESAEKATAWAAAKTRESEAREQLFISLRNAARAERYGRRMGQRLNSLAIIQQAAQIRGDPTLRDEAIAAMALPDVRYGPKWRVDKSNYAALTCDGTGRQYAFLDAEGTVMVRTVEGNRETHRFQTEPSCVDYCAVLAFSPAGNFLARVGGEVQPSLWSLDTGEAILPNAPRGAGAPTFNASGRLFALAVNDEIFCFDLTTRREAARWKAAGRVHTLQFHPANNHIAVGYKNGPYASVYDATNGREIAQLEIGGTFNAPVSWHPDGRRLAVGSTNLGLQIWDVAARQRVAILKVPTHEVDFLTFHPSGNWLASWGWDNMVRLWDTTTQREVMQVSLAANLQFSRDGRWLGFFWPNENEAQLLEFVPPQEYFTLQEHAGTDPKTAQTGAISADDQLLAVATTDGVGLWDFSQRREVARLPCGDTKSVLFEPDGSALWTCSQSGGLQRWGIVRTNTAQLFLGPPRRMALPSAPVRFSADQTARMLVVAYEDGAIATLDMATQMARVLPVSQTTPCYIALSPDAKWLATSRWHANRVQLWNVESGQPVREWAVGLQTQVAFTPDSRELIIAQAGAFEFLKVETFETSRRLKRDIGLYLSHVAFSPDAKLMAMEMSPAVLQLKTIATGQTLAKLEDPHADRSTWLIFSHDGTKLINVISPLAVHVWDLRAIRARLKTMGLDWDGPGFPARFEEAKEPLQIEVITDQSR